MTNTEAIKILNKCRDRGFERTTYTKEEYHTARDMAIKALEQEPPKQECKECKHYPDNDETCLECEYEGITRGYTRYEQEPAYCDRNICLKNEYNGIGCDECEVTKSQEPTCDNCEVGNPCLYCKHEFEPQADGEYINKEKAIIQLSWDLSEVELPRIKESLDKLPSVAVPPEHDGCKDCRWQSQSETEMPCKQCMHNYTDEWERAKIGHWIWQKEDIYQCSECGEDIHVKEVMNEPQYAWCPICGCPMGVEHE